MIRSLGVFVFFGIISAPVGALAEEQETEALFSVLVVTSSVVSNLFSFTPMPDTATTSMSDVEPFRFRVEFEMTWEGEKKEGGVVHLDVGKLHVSKILWLKNLGLFAFSHVGKARSELYGGLYIDVMRGILFDKLFHMSLDMGAGVGAAGVPIGGGGFSIEYDRGFVLRTRAHYHYLTGIHQEAQFRFRIMNDQRRIEPWIGCFERMSGFPDEILKSVEAGPMVGVLIHFPPNMLMWTAWPFRVEEQRTHIRLIFGLEVEL